MPPSLHGVRRLTARFARDAVRRVPVEPVAALPGNPVSTKVLLRRADYELSERDDPAAALKVLDRIDATRLGSRGHALRARALLVLGRQTDALAAATIATEGSHPEALALAAHLEVAHALGLRELEADLQHRAAEARPRNGWEATLLVRQVHPLDVDAARAFLVGVQKWHYQPSPRSLRGVRAEMLELMAGDDAAEVRRLADEEAAHGRIDLATALLHHARDFEGLVGLWRDRRVDPAEFPVPEVRLAAQAALRAGRLSDALVLAERVISHAPDQDEARAIHAQAADQLAIADHGWPVAEAAPAPAYEPRPRAILSVLAQSLPHRSGGYATRSHGMLKGLANLGWSVEGVTRLGFPYDRWPAERTEEVDPVSHVDGVAYHRLLEPGERTYDNTPMSGYIARFAARVEERAAAQGAAVIQASSFQNNGLAGLAAARRLGIPFAYEMRGLEDLMKVSRNPAFETSDSYRYMTGLESHVVANADLTFVISEALREEMIRRGGPADRIVVLPNGVNSDDFVPRDRDEELARELGVEGKTVIGYAGSIVDYEGLDLLLDAVAALRGTRDDFRVVIVGDGHYERKIRAHAEELDLGALVTFTGRVPHEQIPRYLSLFDITPFPRLPLPVCELITPIKPFEAMAMGKALIASSVAALAEFVIDGERGLLFEKGSSESLATVIAAYLDDPDLRRRMGEEARRWVLAERDWKQVMTIADEAYSRLLGL